MAKMRLDEYGFCAVELYASAVCNLNCVYCFQPKVSDHMKKVNEEIVEWITSGRCEDDLLEFCPTVQYISFWGGEPTINLPLFTERLEYFYTKFPDLKEFMFSSNMSTRRLVDNIISFLKRIEELNTKFDREVSVRVQISIDGMPELNDKSRLGSKATEIMDNVTYMLTAVPNYRYGKSNIKATCNGESIRILSDPEKLEENYRFFESYYKRWKQISPEFFPKGGEFITLVAPGGYVSEDGPYLKQIIRTQSSPEFQSKFDPSLVTFLNQVSDRILHAYQTLARNYHRSYVGEVINNCTCSACKTQFGLDHKRNFHLCHGTFFFDKDLEPFLKEHHLESDYERIYGYDWSTLDYVARDKLICSLDDPLNLSRLILVGRNYSYSLTAKFQFYELMIKEMAACGQIPKEFLTNENLRRVAIAYLVAGSNGCPINNVWAHGSFDVDDLSRMRMILNGPLQETLSLMKGRYSA